MISKETVFILGAGAHCSYGFPSGRTLKNDIVRTVLDSMNASSGFDLLKLHGALEPDETEEYNKTALSFAEALEQSGQGSIDAFLNANRHKPKFTDIAKATIAHVLLRCEAAPKNLNDDWLGYLFEVMIDGVSEPSEFLHKNKVSFITFNYDRFLEQWLLRRIQFSFGISQAEALSCLNQIPIYHVYGSLGPVTVATEAVPDSWLEACKGIRTIFDAERYDDAIDYSKRALSKADVVCLLGYGFHRENTQLLSLVECLSRSESVVASSRFGLEDMEWTRLTKLFTDGGIAIKGAHNSHMCRTALRHLPVF